LLGSQYFSEHPANALGSIVANINMIHDRPQCTRQDRAIGQTTLRSATDAAGSANIRSCVWLFRATSGHRSAFLPQHHYNFAQSPAIFFFAGVHEDYHCPSDEVQRLMRTRLRGRAALLSRQRNCQPGEPPKWTASGLRKSDAHPPNIGGFDSFVWSLVLLASPSLLSQSYLRTRAC
jgi:hypothetical protein